VGTATPTAGIRTQTSMEKSPAARGGVCCTSEDNKGAKDKERIVTTYRASFSKKRRRLYLIQRYTYADNGLISDVSRLTYENACGVQREGREGGRDTE
jgi:hypothetical protein